MKTKTVITIAPDGSIQCLGDDTLGLGEVSSVRRVSNIRPVNAVKQIAFRVLRALFADRSRVAMWTRTWRGPWIVTLVDDNKRTFVHADRSACIAWEQEQIINGTH